MSRRDGNWDIYLVNADGSDLTRLTTDPSRQGLPTWSEDGSVISFTTNRNDCFGLVEIDSDMGEAISVAAN